VSHVTDQNATAFQSVEDVVFIGRFGAVDASLQGWFETVAEKYHDRYSFAVSTSKQQQNGPVAECYNNLDGIQRSTTDFSRPSSIESFVKLCSTPLIPELTRRNELSFYEVSF
jgi:protein disulfide-isomerase A1